MTAGWLSRWGAEVPDGNAWLGSRERAVEATLRFERRRADWRLGRWAAKAAVGAWVGLRPVDVEVLAAADGAPEAWREGERLPVTLSLSHRGGRALAVVADAPAAVGCDLELVEPRSDAFVAQWLAPAEQQCVGAASDAADAARLANLAWTAKEAAAKVRREGLRLALGRAEASLATAGRGPAWRPLAIRWPGGEETLGWWREDPGWVMVVAARPALPAPPVALDTAGVQPPSARRAAP